LRDGVQRRLMPPLRRSLMGAQYRYTQKLKRKRAYLKRRKERLAAAIAAQQKSKKK